MPLRSALLNNTEGKSIDVIPTGGACSDDRFGYFMSNTELWRTDGEECDLLVDMVVYGAIANTSIADLF